MPPCSTDGRSSRLMRKLSSKGNPSCVESKPCSRDSLSFSCPPQQIYLNSCSQGPLSDAVRSGFDEYLASWDAHGSPWDIWIERYETARKTFAEFLGARPDEVAILPSASAGINSIASALTFQERKRVVLGSFDFPTMGHVWLSQQARGAEVKFVEAIGDRLPGEYYERIIDDDTLIVPVAGLCFMNGWRAEVKKIVAYAHAQGALVMLDDYQDCGTRPVDVKALDVDIYVTGTLKYLLGPPGLAMMYVRPELTKALLPTISGWFAQSNPFLFDVRKLDPSPTARRFEAGTPAIPNLYAAEQGVRLLQSIGLEQVADHIGGLTRRSHRFRRPRRPARRQPANTAPPPPVVAQMIRRRRARAYRRMADDAAIRQCLVSAGAAGLGAVPGRAAGPMSRRGVGPGWTRRRGVLRRAAFAAAGCRLARAGAGSRPSRGRRSTCDRCMRRRWWRLSASAPVWPWASGSARSGASSGLDPARPARGLPAAVPA